MWQTFLGGPLNGSKGNSEGKIGNALNSGNTPFKSLLIQIFTFYYIMNEYTWIYYLIIGILLLISLLEYTT